MSKFYTFKELSERTPSKERVTEARDLVRSYIQERLEPGQAVVFGSSMWGIRRRFGEQHTMRSDVDVAINGIATGVNDHHLSHPRMNYVASFRSEARVEFDDFIARTGAETGVPIQVIKVGVSEQYRALVNPSTADHFRLLSEKFPEDGYREFKASMNVEFQDRLSDLGRYLSSVWDTWTKISSRHLVMHDDLQHLETLSTLENFPDHFIRKVLGREKMLPCPDSKQNVRKVFAGFPFGWPFRDLLMPTFAKIWELSMEYEELISSVPSRINENAYGAEVDRIGLRLTELVGDSLEKVDHEQEPMSAKLEIIRIPKDTGVVILHHYGDGYGYVTARKLDQHFGNPKEGLHYPVGYANRTVRVKARNGRLVTRWEPTDIFLHQWHKNLRWITDPSDTQQGWFTFKEGKNVYSIKAFDDITIEKVMAETDGMRIGHGKARRNMNQYYRKFVRTALDSHYSNPPRTLLRDHQRPKHQELTVGS